MDSSSQDLARVVIEARVASARARQLALDAKRAGRGRRRRPRLALSLPRLRRTSRRTSTSQVGRPVAGPEPSPALSGRRGDELDRLLEALAQRVAEGGTSAEQLTLTNVAEAARPHAPGAAAALVDWDATEVSRLRAFGIVHGVVLRRLAPQERACLLHRITRGGRAGHALVA